MTGKPLLRRSLAKAIDISALGSFRLSDEAKAEIEALERRQYNVLATSHLYRFGVQND